MNTSKPAVGISKPASKPADDDWEEF